MRDFNTKINDTAPASTGILTAEEDNVRNSELETAVTAGGLSLDAAAGPDTRTDMLAESMTKHASGAMWCTDSGTADTYVATMTGAFTPPRVLFEGLTIRMKIGNACTGASTLNAFSLGVKAVVDHTQGPLIAGVLDGRVAEFVYRASIGAGSWQVPAWSNALYVGTTPSSPPSISSGEGWAVNGSNEGDLNFAGLANDSAPASADIFARTRAADGVHVGLTYAQMAGLLGTGGGILGMQLITASGTYTKTVGTNAVLAFAIGGGGGGGGALSGDTAPGGGGGGMGGAFSDLSAVSTVACTIGAGGTGGVGAAGGTGGSTAFGSYCTSTGGQGGQAVPGSGIYRIGLGGNGGVGSVGLIQISGGPGQNSGGASGGLGGGTWLGGGGRGGEGDYSAQFNGAAGGLYGGGGGGGDGPGSPGNGGAGAPGCILIVEFA
tara:strand:+ start:16040 stop:17344 length:1305 start_codon:yes stop_codon:yes gene_type:complete